MAPMAPGLQRYPSVAGVVTPDAAVPYGDYQSKGEPVRGD